MRDNLKEFIKKRYNFKEFLKNIIWYAVGSFIYAVAVTMLISPNEISPGGFTGIATVLYFLFNLPTGAVLFVLNVPVLIIGYIKFGGKFIINTAVVTALLSIMITLTESFLPQLEVDQILASIFGGGLMGLGASLIMLKGATTGGVDIVAKLIQKRFRHFTMGRIILIMDAIVIAFAVFAYKNVESALYSMISMFAFSKIMDTILYGGDKGKVVYVITSKPDEICREIFARLSRGVTVLDAKGGYTGRDYKMLMCTLRVHEVSNLYSIIDEFDKKAFITVTEAGEIIGEGFKGFY
ncbi:MAG: YitT family protein [Acutalibacteraceae bacterium]|jgi:uncharacterized membrane-anchored protein YitT (DUF2179 family)